MKYTHTGINIGTMPLYGLSIFVNDKLREVPFDETANENHVSRDLK
jgi:hypothetical protein